MLTFTFRYFFGSFLISAMSADRSVVTLFMFSYNCLSFSNCPAVPSPVVQPGHQLVEPLGHRVQPVEERRVGHQLARRALAAIELRRSSVLEVRRRASVSDREKRVVLQQLAEAALAGVELARQRLDVLERRFERVGGLRVVQQLAERAAALLEAVGQVAGASRRTAAARRTAARRSSACRPCPCPPGCRAISAVSSSMPCARRTR